MTRNRKESVIIYMLEITTCTISRTYTAYHASAGIYIFGGPWENRTPAKDVQSLCATTITNSPKLVIGPGRHYPGELHYCEMSTVTTHYSA